MSDSPSAPDAPAAVLPKDRAAEKGMVNVQIDGHWIEVPRGTRIIEAVRQLGREVPHYCYHPKLSSPGNCRMCLVQTGMPPRLAPGQEPTYNEEGYQDIGWGPRPVIACANTVAENMGIRTEGEFVEGCREGVMEFLLINHPLDCPICDQAGECRLQEYSVEHGRSVSRFEENKVKKPKNVDIGPRIRLDDERCILCSRCVRFMDEVADDPVLGFVERGTHNTLTIHPGRELDHNYSLNTADLCPVGALTSNDFRFEMRVWFLRETKSLDPFCGTGTNITIWSRGNEVYRLTPRQNDEVNSCWMPDNHRLGFHFLHAESRLTQPLTKAGETHQPTTWAASIAEIAQRARQLDPSRIAVIGSGKMSNEELYLTKKLAQALGTSKLALVPRQGEPDDYLIAADRNPNTTGAQLIWGVENPAAQLSEIREAARSGQLEMLLVFQEDLLAEAGWEASDLAAVETVAQLHLLANPTASAAEIVWPAAGFAEKRGTYVNVCGRLQRAFQAIEPPGEAREDWETLAQLLESCSGGEWNRPASQDAVFVQLAAEVPEFTGWDFGKIGDAGVVVVETGVTIPLLEREKARIARGEIVG